MRMPEITSNVGCGETKRNRLFMTGISHIALTPLVSPPQRSTK